MLSSPTETDQQTPESRYATGAHGPHTHAERDALFASFDPLVRRLQRQYGSDPELRQELTGEIFCRFCELLADFDPDKGIPIRPYLVRGLTLTVYSYVRSNWRRRRREVGFPFATGSELMPEVGASDEQWIQKLVLEQVFDALPAEIERLPARQRMVIIWRYYDSRSFDEIAELLSVRPATARSLLRHGLNHLRQRLRREESDL